MDTDQFAQIRCILYDFDGVMTDNRVLVDENGKESVFVNRGDGYAVAELRGLGLLQAIVSTETNPVVTARAKKLQIDAIQSVKDKKEAVQAYLEQHKLTREQVMFIGNDLNDLPAFEAVGLKGAPADAEPEILRTADWISEKKGGRGVIRDLYRAYLSTTGQMPEREKDVSGKV